MCIVFLLIISLLNKALLDTILCVTGNRGLVHWPCFDVIFRPGLPFLFGIT